MDTLDKERKLIKERMEQIRENKRNPKEAQYKITIAAGEPVLMDDAEEFKALSRMGEILEFGLAQKMDNEYLELREKTKLEEIDQSLKDQLSSTSESDFDEPEVKEAQIEEEKPQTIQDASIEASQPADSVGIADTREYIKKIVGQSTYSNEAIPLGPSSIEIHKEKTDSDTLKNEINHDSKPDFDYIRSHAIDVDFEPIIDDNQNTFAPNVKDASQTGPEPFAPNMSGQPENQPDPFAPNMDNQTFTFTNSSTSSAPIIGDSMGNDDLESTSNAIEDDEPVEVVKTTLWEKIKDHKKQILIGMGITALAISVAVAIATIAPAALAASQTSQIVGLVGDMIRNGAQWHIASAAEQIGLHASNTTLASIISSLGGPAATYTNATGAWAIGGQTLTQFAATAATNAAAAASKLSLLKGGTIAGAILGGGMAVTGTLLPGKKSQEYMTIKKSIKNLIEAASSMDKESQTKTAQMISNRIISSDRLSDSERNILFRKLQNALKKIKKQNMKMEQPVQEQEQHQEQSIPYGISEEEINEMFYGTESEPEPAKAM